MSVQVSVVGNVTTGGLTDVSALIQEWNMLKAHLAEQSRLFTEYCKPYRERQEAIENALHAFLHQNKLQNVRTEYGTAYKSTSTTPKIEDRDAYLDWCLDNWDEGGNEMLQLGAPQIDAFKRYMEMREKQLEEMKQGGAFPSDMSFTPPGTSVSFFEKVNIRKS
jgi:hypothetical protein